MDIQIKFCDCPCHVEGSTIIHFAPCCDICPKCGLGILSGYKVHFESCEGTLLQKKKRRWKAGFSWLRWIADSEQSKPPFGGRESDDN